MRLEEQLQLEARDRAAVIAARFAMNACVTCQGPGRPALQRVEFRWRKQIGRSDTEHVRCEHTSILPLCPNCLDDLRDRRRWFWVLRYAGGIGLAASLCGIIAVPILLWGLRLTPPEQHVLMSLGVVAIIMLPVASAALYVARRYSVPWPLLEMTANSWECIAIEWVNLASDRV